MHVEQDELTFLAEEDLPPQSDSKSEAPPWVLLVVDDDEEVHHATRFALHDFRFHERDVAIHSVFTTTQARDFLKSNDDVAVVLLDVVMESSDAGLRLVGIIREDLKNTTVRIILRTGQPGYAPEVEAITQYDINDYKSKAELTHTQFISAITAALRSYEQIMTIETSRKGLEMVISASSNLLVKRNMDRFYTGVLQQVCAFLHVQEEGLLCAAARSNTPERNAEIYVMAAAGSLSRYRGQPISEISEAPIRAALTEALRSGETCYGEATVTICLEGQDSQPVAVFVATPRRLTAIDKQLLSVLVSNMSLGLDNASLFERVRLAAYFDKLTGLPNRNQFLAKAQARIRENPSEEFHILQVDLDHFEEINDGLGNDTGDEVLCQVAKLLDQHFAAPCLAARIAGDTFAALIPQPILAEWTIDATRKLFQETLHANGYEISLAATFGGAAYHGDKRPSERVLNSAGMAMKKAKRIRRGSYTVYAEQMETELVERLQLIAKLRSAMQENVLTVYYQPQFSLADQRLVGFEALSRWPVGKSQFIPPDRFISAAEKSGLIIDLGEHVLDVACRQLAAWQNTGHARLRMAVNVSMNQFHHPGFVDAVRRIVHDTGVDPASLELEVTESMVMHDQKQLIEQLAALTETGIKIAVDDFGTGYSSLAYLQELPVHRLKIDRRFIENIVTSAPDSDIAEMIIKLGQRLQLDTIAEGVENKEQAKLLTDLGCLEVQGFFYGKPRPPEEWRALLKKSRL